MTMEVEDKLEAFLKRKRFDFTLAAEIAADFLSWKGKPLDMVHRLVAMKALSELWHGEAQER